jgi:hypothetical protein
MQSIGEWVVLVFVFASCSAAKQTADACSGRGGDGANDTAGSFADVGGTSARDADAAADGATIDAAISARDGNSGPADASSDRWADAPIPDASKDLQMRIDVSVDRTPAPDLAVDTRPRCPYTGHVTYTLAKSANPTADEQKAYTLIAAAMDKAISYYNCYTDITKAEYVTYNPDVSTADGNINGSIRFGHTEYMEYITAMHEIAHTVGIGTASNWRSMLDTNAGTFTGTNATAELRAITGVSTDVVHADRQHFWPYGLNYTSEVKSEADVIDHCRMVVAIRKDLRM